MPNSPRRAAKGGAATSAPSVPDRQSKTYKQQQSRILERTEVQRSVPKQSKTKHETESKRKLGSHENLKEDKRHHPDAAALVDKTDGAPAPAKILNPGDRAGNNLNSVAPAVPLDAVVTAADHSTGNIDSDIADMEIILNEGANIPDEAARHVYIRCKHEDPLALKKINSFAKSDELDKLIGEFPWYRSLSSGPILVLCDTYDQVKILLSKSKFLTIPVSV